MRALRAAAARRVAWSAMSHAYTTLGVICAALLFALALPGCHREGPAEKAGRAMDQAAKDVRDAIKK